jgi:hypothetical protein
MLKKYTVMGETDIPKCTNVSGFQQNPLAIESLHCGPSRSATETMSKVRELQTSYHGGLS